MKKFLLFLFVVFLIGLTSAQTCYDYTYGTATATVCGEFNWPSNGYMTFWCDSGQKLFTSSHEISCSATTCSGGTQRNSYDQIPIPYGSGQFWATCLENNGEYYVWANMYYNYNRCASQGQSCTNNGVQDICCSGLLCQNFGCYPQAVCGDGTCQSTETETSCQQDCGCITHCSSWSTCRGNPGMQVRSCTLTNCATSQSCTCTPNWNCTAWSACSQSGQQTRTCTDSNNCGVTTGKPATLQTCTPSCVENWTCSSWSTCRGNPGMQIRSCSDSKNCGTTINKPATSQSCTCVPNWNCTAWGVCSSGSRSRTCTDSNNCGTNDGRPSILQGCTSCPTGILTYNPATHSSVTQVSGCNIWVYLENCTPQWYFYNPSGSNSISMTDLQYESLVDQSCLNCEPNWNCTAWSACSQSGQQTRTCTDSNNCGISSETQRDCTSTVYCGDGTCQSNENSDTCPADCGTTSPTTGECKVGGIDISFFLVLALFDINSDGNKNCMDGLIIVIAVLLIIVIIK